MSSSAAADHSASVAPHAASDDDARRQVLEARWTALRRVTTVMAQRAMLYRMLQMVESLEEFIRWASFQETVATCEQIFCRFTESSGRLGFLLEQLSKWDAFKLVEVQQREAAARATHYHAGYHSLQHRCLFFEEDRRRSAFVSESAVVRRVMWREMAQGVIEGGEVSLRLSIMSDARAVREGCFMTCEEQSGRLLVHHEEVALRAELEVSRQGGPLAAEELSSRLLMQTEAALAREQWWILRREMQQRLELRTFEGNAWQSQFSAVSLASGSLDILHSQGAANIELEEHRARLYASPTATTALVTEVVRGGWNRRWLAATLPLVMEQLRTAAVTRTVAFQVLAPGLFGLTKKNFHICVEEKSGAFFFGTEEASRAFDVAIPEEVCRRVVLFDEPLARAQLIDHETAVRTPIRSNFVLAVANQLCDSVLEGEMTFRASLALAATSQWLLNVISPHERWTVEQEERSASSTIEVELCIVNEQHLRLSTEQEWLEGWTDIYRRHDMSPGRAATQEGKELMTRLLTRFAQQHRPQSAMLATAGVIQAGLLFLESEEQIVHRSAISRRQAHQRTMLWIQLLEGEIRIDTSSDEVASRDAIDRLFIDSLRDVVEVMRMQDAMLDSWDDAAAAVMQEATSTYETELAERDRLWVQTIEHDARTRVIEREESAVRGLSEVSFREPIERQEIWDARRRERMEVAPLQSQTLHRVIQKRVLEGEETVARQRIEADEKRDFWGETDSSGESGDSSVDPVSGGMPQYRCIIRSSWLHQSLPYFEEWKWSRAGVVRLFRPLAFLLPSYLDVAEEMLFRDRFRTTLWFQESREAVTRLAIKQLEGALFEAQTNESTQRATIMRQESRLRRQVRLFVTLPVVIESVYEPLLRDEIADFEALERSCFVLSTIDEPRVREGDVRLPEHIQRQAIVRKWIESVAHASFQRLFSEFVESELDLWTPYLANPVWGSTIRERRVIGILSERFVVLQLPEYNRLWEAALGAITTEFQQARRVTSQLSDLYRRLSSKFDLVVQCTERWSLVHDQAVRMLYFQSCEEEQARSRIADLQECYEALRFPLENDDVVDTEALCGLAETAAEAAEVVHDAFALMRMRCQLDALAGCHAISQDEAVESCVVFDELHRDADALIGIDVEQDRHRLAIRGEEAAEHADFQQNVAIVMKDWWMKARDGVFIETLQRDRKKWVAGVAADKTILFFESCEALFRAGVRDEEHQGWQLLDTVASFEHTVARAVMRPYQRTLARVQRQWEEELEFHARQAVERMWAHSAHTIAGAWAANWDVHAGSWCPQRGKNESKQYVFEATRTMETYLQSCHLITQRILSPPREAIVSELSAEVWTPSLFAENERLMQRQSSEHSANVDSDDARRQEDRFAEKFGVAGLEEIDAAMMIAQRSWSTMAADPSLEFQRFHYIRSTLPHGANRPSSSDELSNIANSKLHLRYCCDTTAATSRRLLFRCRGLIGDVVTDESKKVDDSPAKWTDASYVSLCMGDESSGRVPSAVFVHVWESTSEATRLHEALERLARVKRDTAIADPVHSPIGVLSTYKGHRVSCLWLIPVEQEVSASPFVSLPTTSSSTDEASIATRLRKATALTSPAVALLRLVGGALGVGHPAWMPPAYYGADQRIYVACVDELVAPWEMATSRKSTTSVALDERMEPRPVRVERYSLGATTDPHSITTLARQYTAATESVSAAFSASEMPLTSSASGSSSTAWTAAAKTTTSNILVNTPLGKVAADALIASMVEACHTEGKGISLHELSGEAGRTVITDMCQRAATQLLRDGALSRTIHGVGMNVRGLNVARVELRRMDASQRSVFTMQTSSNGLLATGDAMVAALQTAQLSAACLWVDAEMVIRTIKTLVRNDVRRMTVASPESTPGEIEARNLAVLQSHIGRFMSSPAYFSDHLWPALRDKFSMTGSSFEDAANGKPSIARSSLRPVLRDVIDILCEGLFRARFDEDTKNVSNFYRNSSFFDDPRPCQIVRTKITVPLWSDRALHPTMEHLMTDAARKAFRNDFKSQHADHSVRVASAVARTPNPNAVVARLMWAAVRCRRVCYSASDSLSSASADDEGVGCRLVNRVIDVVESEFDVVMRPMVAAASSHESESHLDVEATAGGADVESACYWGNASSAAIAAARWLRVHPTDEISSHVSWVFRRLRPRQNGNASPAVTAILQGWGTTQLALAEQQLWRVAQRTFRRLRDDDRSRWCPADVATFVCRLLAMVDTVSGETANDEIPSVSTHAANVGGTTVVSFPTLCRRFAALGTLAIGQLCRVLSVPSNASANCEGDDAPVRRTRGALRVPGTFGTASNAASALMVKYGAVVGRPLWHRGEEPCQVSAAWNFGSSRFWPPLIVDVTNDNPHGETGTASPLLPATGTRAAVDAAEWPTLGEEVMVAGQYGRYAALVEHLGYGHLIGSTSPDPRAVAGYLRATMSLWSHSRPPHLDAAAGITLAPWREKECELWSKRLVGLTLQSNCLSSTNAAATLGSRGHLAYSLLHHLPLATLASQVTTSLQWIGHVGAAFGWQHSARIPHETPPAPSSSVFTLRYHFEATRSASLHAAPIANVFSPFMMRWLAVSRQGGTAGAIGGLESQLLASTIADHVAATERLTTVTSSRVRSLFLRRDMTDLAFEVDQSTSPLTSDKEDSNRRLLSALALVAGWLALVTGQVSVVSILHALLARMAYERKGGSNRQDDILVSRNVTTPSEALSEVRTAVELEAALGVLLDYVCHRQRRAIARWRRFVNIRAWRIIDAEHLSRHGQLGLYDLQRRGLCRRMEASERGILVDEAFAIVEIPTESVHLLSMWLREVVSLESRARREATQEAERDFAAIAATYGLFATVFVEEGRDWLLKHDYFLADCLRRTIHQEFLKRTSLRFAVFAVESARLRWLNSEREEHSVREAMELQVSELSSRSVLEDRRLKAVLLAFDQHEAHVRAFVLEIPALAIVHQMTIDSRRTGIEYESHVVLHGLVREEAVERRLLQLPFDEAAERAVVSDVAFAGRALLWQAVCGLVPKPPDMIAEIVRRHMSALVFVSERTKQSECVELCTLLVGADASYRAALVAEERQCRIILCAVAAQRRLAVWAWPPLQGADTSSSRFSSQRPPHPLAPVTKQRMASSPRAASRSPPRLRLESDSDYEDDYFDPPWTRRHSVVRESCTPPLPRVATSGPPRPSEPPITLQAAADVKSAGPGGKEVARPRPRPEPELPRHVAVRNVEAEPHPTTQFGVAQPGRGEIYALWLEAVSLRQRSLSRLQGK